MVLDAVSNFVRGNTDAAVGTSDTTVSVADASIFPDPATDGEFNVVIWDVNNFPRPDQDGDVEIMRVTARDTTADELTVVRGQETTSAAAHPEGSAIHLSPTAKMFSDIESTFGDFWDAGAQELTGDVNNTNTTTQALETEVTNTNALTTSYAVDVRDYADLQDAIDSVSSGQTIILDESFRETGNNYAISTDAINIVKPYNIGYFPGSGNEDIDDFDMTVNAENVVLIGLNIGNTSGNSISFNERYGRLQKCYLGSATATFAANRNMVSLCDSGDVVFESGTTDSVVDTCTRLTVTDNGDNIVGDIA